jgi:hypothetical protein
MENNHFLSVSSAVSHSRAGFLFVAVWRVVFVFRRVVLPGTALVCDGFRHGEYAGQVVLLFQAFFLGALFGDFLRLLFRFAFQVDLVCQLPGPLPGLRVGDSSEKAD